MQTIRSKINSEEYSRLSKLKPAELNFEIEKTIPIHWSCGYGWYGCRLVEDDGKYYIEHKLGDSCD